MIPVMLNRPGRPADVAKLELAEASDVVAALNLLHNDFALLALPVVQVVLEELNLLLVAVPSVRPKQALAAIFVRALAAHEHIVTPSYHSIAVLLWTQLGLRVLCDHLKLVYLLVVPLDVGGEVFEEPSLHVQGFGAAIVSAVHLLEVLHLVYHVVVET